MKTTRMLVFALLLSVFILTACTTETPMATEMAPEPTNTALPELDDTDDMMDATEDDMEDDDMDASEVDDDEDTMESDDDDMASSEIEDDDDMSSDDMDDTSDDMTTETSVVQDGVIEDGEYAMSKDFGGIRLWWNHDGEYLYVAMEGDTEGWVSLGIEPENGMQGADYIFGYVENGELMIWDAYGTAPRGPNHPPDTDLGGTDNIINAFGVEENGVTRFEVQIPLNSGDQYDKVLEPGMTYSIIVAMGRADDYNGMHSKYAAGEMVLP